MNNKILLTYRHVNRYLTYEWFENIDDLNYFIKNSKGKIMLDIVECIDCSKAVNIDLDELDRELSF
ncbi:hypothetical protein [Clostridium perfringens]|jgi:hypothetical protein|uniref:Uncharacterized protein n=1 Tax=Clostridium perfringens TaxID=1502 RepID=A0AAW4J695_CLOPF|nr:hypothetical protein [Clostridium perfringens]MBO3356308.1 hypothetical protein [Clostridium perfringens]MBO3359561.1 hypothetical protein [Clostridium perfringens]